MNLKCVKCDKDSNPDIGYCWTCLGLLIDNDKKIRLEKECLGCGNNKSPGCIVCWNCFKYREDVIALKYSKMKFGKWLQEIYFNYNPN